MRRIAKNIGRSSKLWLGIVRVNNIFRRIPAITFSPYMRKQPFNGLLRWPVSVGGRAGMYF